MAGNYSPDQLAGNLEQGMKLQPDAYMGWAPSLCRTASAYFFVFC